jgi:hypothetical protein
MLFASNKGVLPVLAAFVALVMGLGALLGVPGFILP